MKKLGDVGRCAILSYLSCIMTATLHISQVTGRLGDSYAEDPLSNVAPRSVTLDRKSKIVTALGSRVLVIARTGPSG